MSFQLTTAMLSDIGQKRKKNQDFATYFEPENPDVLRASGSLYIVADGVGGALKGELASKYAAKKVLYDFYKKNDLTIEEKLQISMREASRDLYQHMSQSNSVSRMATTMVAAVIRGEWLTIANVGDSRAYLLRDGKIRQITRDHSYVGEMVRKNLMTEEEARNSNVKNRITRSLGGEPDTVVDIFKEIQLFIGDKILLCTDGLTRYASQEDILEIAANGSPDNVVERLVDFANRSGGADNISVILISVEKPLAELETTLAGPAVSAIAQKSMAEAQQIPQPVRVLEIEDNKISPPPPGEKEKTFGGGKHWIIILIILFMLFAGTAVLLFLYPDLPSILIGRSSPSPTPTYTAASTATLSSVSTDMVLLPQDETFTPTPTETLTLTPTPTVTSTPTETPTPTATQKGGGYGQIAFASDRSGQPQIYILSIEKGDLQQITSEEGGACQPDWSPDGMRLVFVAPCIKMNEVYPGSGLYIANFDGTGRQPLSMPEGVIGAFDPAWSPSDSNNIAFTAMLTNGRRQIYLFNVADNTSRRLTDTFDNYQPAWSPSGLEIAYTCKEGLTSRIWTMKATGQAQERLTRGGDVYLNFLPAWSLPDGSFIFFNQTNSTNATMPARVMKILAKKPSVPQGEPIGGEATPPILDVDFSTDGKWLVFESSDGTNQDIYMMTVSGTDRTRLTDDPGVDFDPAWRSIW